MSSLKTRLRRQKINEARPVPVWIEYDSRVMTADEAIAAAVRSGRVPEHAVLVILPEPAASMAEWERDVRAEHIARERQRLEQQQQRE